MRIHTRLYVVALLLAAGCARKNDNSGARGVTAPTPSSHTYFDITSGPHAVSCDTCHGSFATFTQFDCLSCHAHDATTTARLHAGTAGYSYESKACLRCHGPGTAKAAFDHAGITGGCATCHDVGASFAALPAADFVHEDTRGADCGECHSTTMWQDAAGAPASLVNDPSRSLALTSELPQWSGTTIKSLQASQQSLPMPMNHATSGVPAAVLSRCTSCHANVVTGVLFPGAFHESLSALGLPAPTVCADCHAVSAPSGFVGPTATQPPRLPPSGEMRHDAVAWSAGAATKTTLVTADCSVCHASPSATAPTTWATGGGGTGRPRFHAALAAASLPQPASCIDCHANTRPVGPVSTTALPKGVTWDHAQSGGLGDCASCHAASASGFTSWGNGRFHTPGGATPASCRSCHEGERPATATGWKSTTYANSPFDYGTNTYKVTHGGGQDCAVCHTGPGTGAWGSSQNWVGGAYSHAATTLAGTTCIACHASQRPDLQPGTTAAAMKALLGFDHSASGVGDCFACHRATVARGSYVSYGKPPSLTALPGGDWHGGVTQPVGPISDPAQNLALTALLPSWVGSSIQSFSSTVEQLPMPMDHATAAVPASTLGTCGNCHAGAATGHLYPGALHASLAKLQVAQPVLCASCHASSMPVGFVGPTAARPPRVPASGEMKHDAVAWSQGAPTTTAVLQVDCSTCHASPTSGAASWATGTSGAAVTFHASLAAAKATQPSSCIDCHANTRPVGTISAPAASLPAGVTFDHAAVAGGLGDCSTCHGGGPAPFTSWAGGRFHLAGSATPTSCGSCHAGERPTTTAGWKSTTFAVSPFDYATHGDGLECATCHTGPGSGAWGGTQNWVGGKFAHAASSPAGTTCIACHSTQRPDLQPGTTAAAMAGLLGFDHSTGGTADCITCHQATVTRGTYVNYGKPPSVTALPGGDWQGGLSYPEGLASDPTRDVSVSSLIPTWVGTSIQSFSSILDSLPMPMDHQDPQLATVLSTCGTCHSAAASGVFYPGTFHASLAQHQLAQPTLCEGCHATSLPTGFVGPTATSPTRSPPSGEMDHDAVAWSAGAPTTTRIVSADCGVCHATPPQATAWSTGPSGSGPAHFHAALATARLQQPSSCIACHANTRPAALVSAPTAALPPGVSFDHGTVQGSGDCTSCHAASVTVFTSWSGGRFHTAGSATPTTCLPCHAGERPTSTTAWTSTTYSTSPFDYGTNSAGIMHGDGLDCATCHRGPGTGAWGGTQNWVGGAFTHGSSTPSARTCNACHSTQRPDLQPGTTAAAMASLLGFDHSTSGTGDCIACHGATVTRGTYVSFTIPGGDWRGGATYPVGPVSDPKQNVALTALSPSWVGSSILSFTSSVEQLPMPMDHASAALASGVITTCVNCHAGAATGALYPGLLHGSLATLQLAQPVLCASCHASSMPVGFVGPTATSPARVPASGEMKHDAVVWSQGVATTTAVVKVDCAVCHAVPTKSTGSWAVSASGSGPVTFHASLTTAHATQPSSCIDCHANTRPVGAVRAPAAALPAGVSFDHAAVAGGLGDCSSCHAASASTFASWSGGRFHASGSATPSSCLSCHAGERPTTTTGWKSTSWSTSPFDYATHGDGLDCATCHTGPGTGSWGGTQNWIGGTYGHGAGTPAAVTCVACHSTQRPDLQPGTTAAAMATLLGFDHSTSGTGDCIDCHQATVARASYVNYGKPPSLTALPGGDWQGGLGYPGGLVSDPTRDVSLGVLIPTWAGVSIQSFTASQDTLLMPMDHQSPQIASLLSNCATCHLNASSGAFYPGDYHSSLANNHLPAPALCGDCHAGSMPDGFVGPTASSPARTPASGEMNHDAVAWSSGAPTTTHLVTADCSVCHASPTQALNATWSTSPTGSTPATFHGSLTTAKLAQPTSCIACHANTRPATVISAPAAALPAGVTFDHASVQGTADCTSCHAGTSTWANGRFHVAGSTSPTACLPCHTGERPTAATGWQSTSYTTSPFDYGTNSLGVTHGDGQDCAVCHRGPGTGAWGGTQNWVGGAFSHAAGTPAGVTCIACHTTQRPDLQPGTTAAAMATLLGFDHAANGTGDCFGCHEATVAAGTYVNYGKPPSITALPGGDWQGGLAYPGSALVGSASAFISFNEIDLLLTSGLVTGMTTTTATVYAQMQHTAAAIPPSLKPVPPGTNCGSCHTAAYAQGRFHPVLTALGLPQPTSGCSDCHSPMRPSGIVELAGSELEPMDHAATFVAAVTLGGVSVTGVSAMDCSTCHNDPGGSWQGAMFHANIGAAVPSNCVSCHYPLMADPTVSDLASGTSYQMTHGSSQLTFQACNRCHTTALAAAPQLPVQSDRWAGGALHPATSPQPKACNECHTISRPATTTQSTVTYVLAQGGTATNGGQWMSHGSASVTGKDCATCHAADAKTSGSAWSRSASFHAAVSSPATCAECHGLTNGGGSTAGTKNNLPAGLTNSTTLTTAAADPTTGVPVGTYDQVSHADVNVTAHDCSFCHTQAGVSTTPGIAGHEWAQASFHVSFTAGSTLTMNGTTGRCSNCHFNLKPGATFLNFDHSGITNAAGSQDCSACHSWPGTGTAAAPNWLGAAGAPTFIAVGGFNVSQPPATATTAQPGIANLPHPTVGTMACTSCHTQPGGGKPAIGYDHASTLASSQCAACHEAGTNLVGTPWNGSTTQSGGAGDSRPYTLKSVIATKGGDTLNVTWPNHFYKNGSGVVVDCSQCHMVPTGTGAVTTGTSYTSAWTFPHNTTKMTNPSTCVMCHTNGIPN